MDKVFRGASLANYLEEERHQMNLSSSVISHIASFV